MSPVRLKNSARSLDVVQRQRATKKVRRGRKVFKAWCWFTQHDIVKLGGETTKETKIVEGLSLANEITRRLTFVISLRMETLTRLLPVGFM